MAHLKDAPDGQVAYVVVVARRTRQLLVGGRPMVDNPRSRKTTRIAEEEHCKRVCWSTTPPTSTNKPKTSTRKRRSELLTLLLIW